MSIPCQVQFKFGPEMAEGSVSNDAVLTTELKDRMTKLLTGQFNVEADGRCILMPDVWDQDIQARDSVCVGVDLGPISFDYCRDI